MILTFSHPFLTIYVLFYSAGTAEKEDNMALTNPMPMGPWKVSICFAHHLAGMQAAAQVFSLCSLVYVQ